MPRLNEEIRTAALSAPLSLRFTGSTAGELTAWQAQFASKLRELIGPHEPPARWEVRALGTESLADHVREEILLTAEGLLSQPLYILRPRAPAETRFPVVVCLHGHGLGHDTTVGRGDSPALADQIRRLNYDYGLKLARAGYLVVAPGMIPFGRRLDDETRTQKSDPCAIAFVRLMMLGRTVVGENVRGVRWALNYALERPDTRPDRVGCVGLSYGGRMTMIVAALDPRIRVAVLSGVLNLWQERMLRHDYSCGAQVIPGILEYGDTAEIGSLIAPRSAIWEVGSRDPHIVPGWDEQAAERLRRAYAASGRPEALSFHHFDGAHEWNGETAVPLLLRELKSP